MFINDFLKYLPTDYQDTDLKSQATTDTSSDDNTLIKPSSSMDIDTSSRSPFPTTTTTTTTTTNKESGRSKL